jgi:hypothetical protein
VLPTPPKESFLLLPDLNSADADQLTEWAGLSAEQAQQVIEGHPYLNWGSLNTKFPNLPQNLKHRARL